MSQEMTGAEMVIQALKDQGVDTLFGYPGGAVLPIYDALFQQDGIHHILVRHEQGAAHAAEGYARSSGRTGVLLVTSGPGVTNTITGLTDAMMDSIPIVCISGQVPTHLIGSDAFQECDTVGITRHCTKHNYLVKRIEDLPRILHEAFYVAATGRPGPVVVDIPKDIQFQQGLYEGPDKRIAHKSYHPRVQGDPDKIQACIALMRSAQRPIFYTGGGVICSGTRASDLLLTLVELTGFPITSTLMGLGAYPAAGPHWLGMLGMHGTYEANNAMHDCDLMIAIGARFDDRVTGRLDAFSPHSKKIHIDIDPSSINKTVKVDLPLIGDCGAILEEIIKLWKEKEGDQKTRQKDSLAEWWHTIEGWRQRKSLSYRNSLQTIKPQYAIQRLYQHTRNKEVYITTEVGQHQMWAAQYFHFQQPRHWMTSGGLGTMGYGLPAAIGVQTAHPEALVIDIAGEASILMNMQELSTAKQYRLPVKIFIINNQYMGMVRQWQELLHGGRYSESYSNALPDFVKLAEAYGAKGLRCEDPSQLDAAIEEMIHTPQAVVFDCIVEREENCFPMIPSGKAHNDMILPDLSDDAGLEIGAIIDEKGKMLV